MRDAGRRPMGRLFYWALILVVVAYGFRAAASGAAPQSGANTTSVADTVYMADGTPAGGTLIITWPAFVTSTTVQVDIGIALPTGWGVEVRAHDYGWGPSNGRNVLGRFTTQAFSLPRLARTQNYFLRAYDSSSPTKYSRYSAALHVDYPL